MMGSSSRWRTRVTKMEPIGSMLQIEGASTFNRRIGANGLRAIKSKSPDHAMFNDRAVRQTHIQLAPGRKPEIVRGLHACYFARDLWEVYLQRFVHEENIALYRRLLSESEIDPSRDEDRHKMLLTLLAEEMAKDVKAKHVKKSPDS
jgi:hypothetical protein